MGPNLFIYPDSKFLSTPQSSSF